jgi:hypothetical protein
MERIFGIWPFHNRDFSFFKFWIVWFLGENQKKWMTSDSARATTFPNPHLVVPIFPEGDENSHVIEGGKRGDRSTIVHEGVGKYCLS